MASDFRWGIMEILSADQKTEGLTLQLSSAAEFSTPQPIEVAKNEPKETAPQATQVERDTIITLPGGTEIELQQGSMDGVKLSDIKIVAEEYYSQPQMIVYDMFTQDVSGTCLKTGGMLTFRFLSVKDNKPVTLLPGRYITIRIPQITEDTVFSLFDSPMDAKVNPGWKARPEKVTYLRNIKMFEFLIYVTAMTCNLDTYLSDILRVKQDVPSTNSQDNQSPQRIVDTSDNPSLKKTKMNRIVRGRNILKVEGIESPGLMLTAVILS